MISKNRKPTVLMVYDTATTQYKRFKGNQRTHHVRADFPLTAELLEQFRVDPDSVLGSDDGDNNEVD